MAVYKGVPTKDGRQYFFRIKYKDIFGETIDYSSKKYKGKKEAENAEAEYRLKINKHEINRSNPTFNDIFSEWIVDHKSQVKEQTILKIKDRYKHLKMLYNVRVNDFNVEKYKLFVNELKGKHFSVNYSNKILGILKNLIKHSKKYYNTSDKMLAYIENFKSVNESVKEMIFFTYEEYLKFDSVIDEHQWHTFFEILYFMGLRQGELQALTWNDIKNNELSIKKTLSTKIKGKEYIISTPKTKNSIRTLPIPKNVLNDLKIMSNEAKKYKDYSDKWFIFGNTVPFKESTIQKHKNNYCKEANLKQIRIHDFRHSCASFLINHNASIPLVSKYLGHSKVSITLDVYSHFYESELNNIIKIIDNL